MYACKNYDLLKLLLYIINLYQKVHVCEYVIAVSNNCYSQ